AEITAAPLSATGAAAVCILVDDLTDRDARRAAEAANLAKDRFLALLSHELRTPLTPVGLTLQQMSANPSFPPEFREDLAMIWRNIELEIRLIDDLLDLSRITSGKLRLQRQRIG